MTLRLIFAVLLCLASFQASAADGPCSEVDPKNAKSVRTCLETRPGFSKEMVTQNYAKSYAGCSLMRLFYSSSDPRNRADEQQPTCIVFGQVIEQIQDQPPLWQDCALHFERGKKLRPCFDYLVESLPYRNRARMTCDPIQKMLQGMSNTMRPPGDGAYSPPGCDEIDKLIDSNPLIAEARKPAGGTSTSQSTASNRATARGAGSGETVKAKPEGIHNQHTLRLRKNRATSGYASDMIFTSHSKQANIRAELVGACAPKIFVSITTQANEQDFDLAKHPGAAAEMAQAALKICPQAEDILFQDRQYRDGKTRTLYYRSRSKKDWKLTRAADPFSGRDSDVRIVFARGKEKNEIIGYLRGSDDLVQYVGRVKKNGDVTGFFYSYGGPKGGRCGELRRGYPAWGKFKIPAKPNQMAIGWCEGPIGPMHTAMSEYKTEIKRALGK